ncbi:hypothetical protein BGZ92_007123 [Podila epicladia]|nr:hypothetical protein BGZ92_007123 [Podila epicladia]
MAEPTEKEISVPWPTKTAITVQLTTPPKGVKHSGFALVLGPGAGGDENQALLVEVAKAAAKEGHFCARYRAKVPNLGFRVNVCTRVIEYLFHPATGQHPMKGGCFLGGHSMGTRVAGTVAEQFSVSESSEESAPAKKGKGKKAAPAIKEKTGAESSSSGYPPNFIRGLTLFSYPLHTPDNTKALRDQILLDIPSNVATLMVSGLKDSMCQTALFAKVFKDMKSSPREVVHIEGADHGLGFGSAKSHAGKKETLISAIAEWTVQFIDEAIAKKESAKAEKAIVIKKKAELKKVADEWTVAITTA